MQILCHVISGTRASGDLGISLGSRVLAPVPSPRTLRLNCNGISYDSENKQLKLLRTMWLNVTNMKLSERGGQQAAHVAHSPSSKV